MDNIDEKGIYNKLNNYIDIMTKKGKEICDSECQSDANKKLLFDQYLKAKNNLIRAPGELKTAEKDYFIKTGQKINYDNLQESRALDSMHKYMQTIEANFNKKIDRISSLKSYLESQKYFQHNIVDSYDTYKYRLGKYEKEVNSTTNQSNIDNRMANFYNDKSKSLAYWSNGFLFYIYIILVIISILLFVLKKNYRNLKMYPFLLCVIILPFFIHDIYEIILEMTRHIKMDNTYFVFTLFSLFLIYTLYLTANIPQTVVE